MSRRVVRVLMLLRLCVCLTMCIKAHAQTGWMDEDQTMSHVYTTSWTIPPTQDEAADWQGYIFSTLTSKQYMYYHLRLAEVFYRWMTNIVPPLSLVLNCCTLVVFLQKSRRKQTVSMVMKALALADIFSLTMEWSNLVGHHTDFYIHNLPVLCDIVYYVTYSGRTCSSWFVFLFTMERFVAVRFPLRKAILLTRRRMAIIIITLTSCCLVSQVYFIVIMNANSRYDGLGEYCDIDPKFTIQYYTKVKFIVREIIGFIVPSLMTGALNIRIVMLLKKWVQKREALTGSDSKGKKDHRSLTVMLVTVSAFSIVTSGPYACLQVYTGAVVGNNFEHVLLLMVLSFYLQAVSCMNYTVNFLLYCLGGRQFREEFIQIITCGRGMWYI